MGVGVEGGDLFEGRRALGPLLRAIRLLAVQRIDALAQQLTGSQGSFSSLRQRYQAQTAQPHFTRLAGQGVAQQPGLAFGISYLEPQAVTIAVSTGVVQAPNLDRCQLAHRASPPAPFHKPAPKSLWAGLDHCGTVCHYQNSYTSVINTL